MKKKNQPENAFSPLESCHLYMYPWCRAPAGNRSLKISRARPSLQKEKLPKPIRLSSPVFCILKKKQVIWLKISPNPIFLVSYFSPLESTVHVISRKNFFFLLKCSWYLGTHLSLPKNPWLFGPLCPTQPVPFAWTPPRRH